MGQFKVLSIDACSDGQSLDHLEVHTWFERDCALVEVRDSVNDKTLVEWIDGQVNKAVTDGFLDSKDFEKSALKYAKDHDLIGDNGIRWTWNQWYTQATRYDESQYGPLTEKSALEFFKNEYVNDISQFEIDDDQYNLVLVEKSTRRPILAIEYVSNIE